ncbi:hypothetical protein ACKKBG_A14280 [Auxenochlorella protothecoides x Auxenochlorella symbiontica]
MRCQLASSQQPGRLTRRLKHTTQRGNAVSPNILGPQRRTDPPNLHQRCNSVGAAAPGQVAWEPITPKQLALKLGVAASTGKLDLSGCGLRHVPPEVFDITDLEELSLAGNGIEELPEAIASLPCLTKLQLAGNEFRRLPAALTTLQDLRGLWLHGNALETLPEDLGALAALELLSLAGNALGMLPWSVGDLHALRELNLAGNALTALPGSIGGLRGLQTLSLLGNRLEAVPETLGALGALRELWLQGNPGLGALPEELGGLTALTHASAADCGLARVPGSLLALPRLRTLSLYGNRLATLPAEALQQGTSLRRLWLEGNPLDAGTLASLIAGARMSQDVTVGLDESQLQHAAASEGAVPIPANVQRSEILAPGPGLFKLVRWAGLAGIPAAARPSATQGAPLAAAETLLVAFGSAPGVPNWAGALKKVAARPEVAPFDVLFVVDAARAWYHGGDAGIEEYAGPLRQAASCYRQVVLLGDSMGGTAALLFAGQATKVVAFCPQVDLARSAIRPAGPAPWRAALQRRVEESVAACRGVVDVHVGTWEHDQEQVQGLGTGSVVVHVHPVNSHRLSAELARSGELEVIIAGSLMPA